VFFFLRWIRRIISSFIKDEKNQIMTSNVWLKQVGLDLRELNLRKMNQ